MLEEQGNETFSRMQERRKEAVEMSLKAYPSSFHTESALPRMGKSSLVAGLGRWRKCESLMDSLLPLPLRGVQEDEGDGEDPYRTVLFEDVSPFLLPFCTRRGRLALTRAMWTFCGCGLAGLGEARRYDPLVESVLYDNILDFSDNPSDDVKRADVKVKVNPLWSRLIPRTNLTTMLGSGLGSILSTESWPFMECPRVRAFIIRALSLMVDGGEIDPDIALETIMAAASINPTLAYALSCRSTMAFPGNVHVSLARSLLGIHLGLESEIRWGMQGSFWASFPFHQSLLRALAEFCIKKRKVEVAKRICMIWASCLNDGVAPSPLGQDKVNQVIVCARQAFELGSHGDEATPVSSMEILRARRLLHLSSLLDQEKEGKGDSGILWSILEFSIGGLGALRASPLWKMALEGEATLGKLGKEELLTTWVWLASLELDWDSRNGRGYRPRSLWEVLEVALRAFPHQPLFLESYHRSGMPSFSYRLDQYLVQCHKPGTDDESGMEEGAGLGWGDRTFFYGMMLWMNLAYPLIPSFSSSMEKALLWVERALDAPGGKNSPGLWILQAKILAWHFQRHGGRKRRESAYASIFEAIRTVPWCKGMTVFMTRNLLTPCIWRRAT